MLAIKIFALCMACLIFGLAVGIDTNQNNYIIQEE